MTSCLLRVRPPMWDRVIGRASLTGGLARRGAVLVVEVEDANPGGLQSSRSIAPPARPAHAQRVVSLRLGRRHGASMAMATTFSVARASNCQRKGGTASSARRFRRADRLDDLGSVPGEWSSIATRPRRSSRGCRLAHPRRAAVRRVEAHIARTLGDLDDSVVGQPGQEGVRRHQFGYRCRVIVADSSGRRCVTARRSPGWRRLFCDVDATGHQAMHRPHRCSRSAELVHQVESLW